MGPWEHKAGVHMGSLRANPGGDSAEFGGEFEPKCPVHAAPAAMEQPLPFNLTTPTLSCFSAEIFHFYLLQAFFNFLSKHFYVGYFNTLVRESQHLCHSDIVTIDCVFSFQLGFSWFLV